MMVTGTTSEAINTLDDWVRLEPMLIVTPNETSSINKSFCFRRLYVVRTGISSFPRDIKNLNR